jgi:putative endonuclease
MSEKIKFGQAGENKATEYLESNGYCILDRNYRCRFGEIDIIAYKNETVCFIEVKSRHNVNYGRPCEAVNNKKQRHIRNTANYYLICQKHKIPISELDVRFDIIEIIEWTSFKTTEMEHIINAF